MRDRPRCKWAKFRECSKLLCGKRFSLQLKWVVYKSYVRPAILYGSEIWCMKKREEGILQKTDIRVENVWSTAQR